MAEARLIIADPPYPVRVLNFKSYTLDMNGHIVSFDLCYMHDSEEKCDTYQYFVSSDFLKKDSKRNLSGGRSINLTSSGYYKVSDFMAYLNGKMTLGALIKTEFHQFTRAVEGDVVTCEITKAGFNNGTNDAFSNYYRVAIYRFRLFGPGLFEYRSENDFPVAGLPLSMPNGSTLTAEWYNIAQDSNRPAHASGLFYAENYGHYVDGWQIPNQEDLSWNYVNGEQGNPNKFELGQYMTIISFRIHSIQKEVLPKLAIKSIENIQEYYKNYIYDTELGLSHYDYLVEAYELLPEIDKTIAKLMRDWGVMTSKYSNIPFGPILPTVVPDVEAVKNYGTAIYQFYHHLHYLEEDSIPKDSDGRMQLIAKVLPLSSLVVLPEETRLRWLETHIRYGEIEESDQRLVVNLVLSFMGTPNADVVMDYFLEMHDGKTTNFEILYTKLDDARIERYPVVNLFVDRETNRMNFIYALHDVWKTSKYNFSHIPNGVVPNGDGVDPDNFWLTSPGSSYFPKYNANGDLISGSEPIIEFGFEGAGVKAFGSETGEGVRYEPREKFSGEKIIIDKVKYTNKSVWSGNTVAVVEYEEDPSYYGKYHLYQPIILLNYQADLDLVVPNADPIPAFLFYYAKDYDRIKDIDAGILLAADITVEIITFFTTGGISSLRHLRHLKHITKLFKVKTAYSTFNGAEKVLFWRGMEGAAEITSVTSATMFSYFNYAATVTNDPDIQELNRKISYFFLSLTFLSAGGAVGSRHRCARNAKDVVAHIDYLTSINKAHSVPQDSLDIMYTVINTASVKRTEFYNYFTSPSMDPILTGPNYITDTFANIFTDADKVSFWHQFGNRIDGSPTNRAFWNKMNKAESGLSTVTAARMKAWKNAPDKFKFVRRDTRFLDEVVKLDITDYNSYDHLANPANRPPSSRASTYNNITGGHKSNLIFDGSDYRIVVENGMEIIDPTFVPPSGFIDVSNTSQRMIDYLYNTGGDVYNVTPHSSGHIRHENLLFKKVNQPAPGTLLPKGHVEFENQFILNGVTYQKKVKHTQINPNWSETDIKYEFAYAAYNKRRRGFPEIKENGNHELSGKHVTTYYDGELIDGTPVEIKHQNYFRWNLHPTFDDHYEYFEMILE